MGMLMELLRYKATDEGGRSASVSDLEIELLDDDHPPVTALIVSADDEPLRVPWEQVISMDNDARTLTVRDLKLGSDGERPDAVLLKRDILDSLILDLLGRRTTRVCDLMLENEDGTLRLIGADAGFSAMLRRVFRGRWPKVDPKEMFDWKYVEFLRGDPQAVANGAGYRLRINRLPPGEIARLSDYIPYLHAAELLRLLPDDKAADVLEATTIERQLQVIDEFDDEQAVGLLSRMSPDRATDLIGRLSLAKTRRYLNELPAQRRELILELLRFPEDSVGGAMTNDILIGPAAISCARAKEIVQKHLETIDFSTVVFIVDGESSNRLKGSINLRELLAADDELALDDAMNPYIQVLNPFDDAGDAAYRIVSGQLAAMPVINKDGAIIGAMTVEAAIARLVPATSDLQRIRIFS
jgi:magnesium transporter